MCGIGYIEFRKIQTRYLECPTRCTVSTRHACPYILMEIDKNMKSEIAGATGDRCQIIEIGLVINPGACVLDRLPSGKEPQTVKSPSL